MRPEVVRARQVREPEQVRMTRFHVHVSVSNLKESIGFYSTLFATSPTRIETDYAKWMLEDPRIIFFDLRTARRSGGGSPGIPGRHGRRARRV